MENEELAKTRAFGESAAAELRAISDWFHSEAVNKRASNLSNLSNLSKREITV
jgi:hypothetical protein